MKNTPITDRLEESIEATKRDVPVRVYHLMRALEVDRALLLDALRPFADLDREKVPVKVLDRLPALCSEAREALDHMLAGKL